jgi:hypothetical protein
MIVSGNGAGWMRKNQWYIAVAVAWSMPRKISRVGAMSRTASRSTRSAWSSASRWPTRPPRSCPATRKRSKPSCDITSTMSFALSRFE